MKDDEQKQSVSALSMYDVSIPAFQGGLRSLYQLLDKAEEHASRTNIPYNELLEARLYEDMDAFRRQIQHASDSAKAAASRLAGRSVPRFEDTEQSFDELRERVRKTEEILADVSPYELVGSETKSIKVNLRRRWVAFDGYAYLNEFAIPNFFFHVTTAYAILRSKGVPLSKLDYLTDVSLRRKSGGSDET